MQTKRKTLSKSKWGIRQYLGLPLEHEVKGQFDWGKRCDIYYNVAPRLSASVICPLCYDLSLFSEHLFISYVIQASKYIFT